MSCVLVFSNSSSKLLKKEYLSNNFIDDVEIIEINKKINNFSIIKEYLPKTIIIDSNYESKNNFSICERLKLNEEIKYIPIIVIVDKNANNSIINRYYELGADIVIKKPISDFELSSNLRILFQICKYKQKESFDNLKQENTDTENKKSSVNIFRNLYNIVEGVADIIILTTKLGEIIELSEQSYKLLGYNRTEIAGKKISYIVPNHDIAKIKNIELQLKNSSFNCNCEFTIRKKDGTLIVIQWVINKFKDNRDVERIYFAGRNITHDRIIDRELSKRERDFKSIFENSIDAIYIQDKNGVFIDVNPGAEKMYGYSYEEMIGKTPETVSAPGKNNLKEVFEKFEKAYNGEPQQLEFWGKRKNGEIFPKLISLTNGTYLGQDVVITFAIDITNRKLAEDALRNSEEKYRLLVNNTKDVIWKIDINKKFTYISPAVEKLTGYTQEEYLQFSLGQCMKDEDMVNMEMVLSNEIEKIALGDFDNILESYVADITVIHKDGRNILCEMKAFIILDNKRIVGIQGIISDITKRKEDERKLRESEKRFSSFMKFLPSLVFIKNENGDYVYTNKHYNEFFENKNSVIGKNLHDIFPESIAKSMQIFDNDVLNAGAIVQEQILNDKDNKDHVFKTYKFPIVFDDETKLIGGFALDITKEKKAELIQQVLYNISNAANSTLKTKEFLVKIQQELSKLIDTKNYYIAMYNKEKDIIELPYMDDERKAYSIAPNNSATAYVIKTKKSLLAKKQKIVEFEKAGKFEMTGIKSAVWLGVPLKSNRKVIGMIGVQSYTDENAYSLDDKKILEIVATQIGFYIERKNAHLELLNAKEKAEESDRLKSVFLTNMSHEIRTPMNGMIGFAEMLKLKNLSNEKIDTYVDMIDESGSRLLKIINDIIDISKIETKQISLNRKNVSINKVVKDVYNLFIEEKELLAKKIKLFYNVDLQDNESFIYTDSVRIKQILSNLLYNAIKFTDKGSVSFGYNITDNNMLKFFVKDSGIGIRGEDKEIIFKKFRQLDEGSTRKYGGTGIGLSISKEFVKMLGGEIWVETQINEGTTFYFTIPIIKSSIKSNLKTIIEESKNNLEKKKLKILIAEDDQFNFELLENVLDFPDIETIRAKDGEEAVEIAKQNFDIDIILMDIKMPKKDGLIATGEIKKFRPKLPIIAQTAYAMEGDKEKAIQAGCDDYIAKPIIPDKLLYLIKQYV